VLMLNGSCVSQIEISRFYLSPTKQQGGLASYSFSLCERLMNDIPAFAPYSPIVTLAVFCQYWQPRIGSGT
jgi:hypothetical protein